MIKNRALLTMFSFLSMFFLGVSGSVIGAAAKNIGLTPFQIGIILASQNAGFIISVILSGSLSDTAEKTKLLFIGSIILGLSFLVFYRVPSFAVNVGIMFMIGFGIGIYEGTTDPMLLEIHKQNPGIYININHFFVNIGSLTITVYLIFLEMNWRRSMVQSGILVLALGLLFLLSKIENHSVSEISIFKRLGEIKSDIYRIVVIFTLTAIAVGMETGTIGILTSFLMDLREFNQFNSKMGLIIFVSGIATGRLLTGYITKKVKIHTILQSLFLTGSIFYSLLYFLNTGRFIYPVIYITGLTVSAVLPLLITLTGAIYPDFSGTALGVIKMGIPIGGIIIPLIVSFVSKFLSFKYSLAVFPAVYLFGFLIFITNKTKLAPSKKV